LLTARDIRRHEIEHAQRDGIQAECLATVGLGNLLAVGDPTTTTTTTTTTAPRSPVGTINLVCRVSVGLTEEALLEATAIAAEARTAAVLAAGLRSPLSGRPATGTGTDCIVMAAPATGRPDRFAGKHTACGSAIGAAVFGAVSRGVARWLEENACPTP
jgi:adenosylcobinamide amidohydrolase